MHDFAFNSANLCCFDPNITHASIFRYRHHGVASCMARSVSNPKGMTIIVCFIILPNAASIFMSTTQIKATQQRSGSTRSAHLLPARTRVGKPQGSSTSGVGGRAAASAAAAAAARAAAAASRRRCLRMRRMRLRRALRSRFLSARAAEASSEKTTKTLTCFVKPS
jgi:hypothetical protein